MISFFLKLIGIVLVPLMLYNCHGKNTVSPDSGDLSAGQKIYIQDRTGKLWDVTHAVDKYGFETRNFQYGLGPNAIRPINQPEMLSPGDTGYPRDNSGEGVIGLSIDGDTRAYPIRLLSYHEVVNDRVGGQDVAVVY
jgi:hypothetical protein